MQLVVGRVARPHGLGGEVSVEVRTDSPEQRFAVGAVLATEPAAAGPLTVAGSRWHLGRLLVRFESCADRSSAEEISGALLVVDSAQLAAPEDPAEFHDFQLIGLAVLTCAGERVGVIADVLHYGQDLLVITGEGDRVGAQILVPFVSALVPDVNLAAGTVVIDPPPGLLDSADVG